MKTAHLLTTILTILLCNDIDAAYRYRGRDYYCNSPHVCVSDELKIVKKDMHRYTITHDCVELEIWRGQHPGLPDKNHMNLKTIAQKTAQERANAEAFLISRLCTGCNYTTEFQAQNDGIFMSQIFIYVQKKYNKQNGIKEFSY